MSNDTGAAQAILRFLPGFQQAAEGELKAGGRLELEYAPDRVACRRERLGVQIGRLSSFVRFHPARQLYHGTLQLSVPVPFDATAVELWFYSYNSMGCTSWDSRFGQNYWYKVAGPVKAVDNVYLRAEAVASLEMVNSVQESASKIMHSFGVPPSPSGGELQTILALKAWCRNVAYEKNVWVDVHLFDANSARIHAETFTLHYLAPADGGGDVFGFEDVVYRGSGAVPGSVWTQPDARKLQFRLYYEVNHRVFTDDYST